MTNQRRKEPTPPEPNWPRHSSRPFPAYRFVPGVNAHPRRDPSGHSYGTPEPTAEDPGPDRWRENEAYLSGIDLYNFAYWWEAHEQLEALWKSPGSDAGARSYYQGLIQLSAANLKRHMDVREGARRLASHALDKFRRVTVTPYMGVDLPDLIRRVDAHHLREKDPIPLIRLQ